MNDRPKSREADLPPEGTLRITLNLTQPEARLDGPLLQALRAQNDHLSLKNLSRTEFKLLFKKRKIRIKGQFALASSGLAAGTTYVDVAIPN